MSIKLAVIYYSSTGTNYQMAQWAEQGAKEADAEVKLLKIPETAPEAAIDSNPAWRANADATKDVPEVTLADLEWADAIVFSFPTRFGNIASQVQAFIDTAGGLWAQGKLANKVVSAMSSASNPHGGQEATLLSFYTTMFHWGAIVAAPGFTDPSIFAGGGNPYGASSTQGQDGKIVEDNEAAVKHQAKRTATVAEWIQKGQE
ncbi:NAD(P)H:quinone oxidoreductase [Cytobacillus sp. FSL R7-0696]|uniref:NAD(P)H:quinone oxidoreductase n=1 Tax=Cytobacillus sp. FSL R7-0696 TaxID=2921691 RepID=UPI0030FB2E6C